MIYGYTIVLECQEKKHRYMVKTINIMALLSQNMSIDLGSYWSKNLFQEVGPLLAQLHGHTLALWSYSTLVYTHILAYNVAKLALISGDSVEI